MSADGTDEPEAPEGYKFMICLPEGMDRLAFFRDGAEIGSLTWKDGEIRFDGDAGRSAADFFAHFVRPYMDRYFEMNMAQMVARAQVRAFEDWEARQWRP